ncbi:peptidylprolyl isomerase [Piscinibacter koreensis]|uniref:peptidylprolyl isomerase n=1 Tax=Piscinibacter koreensis TaxID=2742824 RepID=A0A7Y6NS00_9BURK|nr:peptidylprolyl isomerase [Schlegelella koreensis]NUZ08214.1 peptidylprolyl isomerase [Schlegelella koreensis]
MKKTLLATCASLALVTSAAWLPATANAQNVAIVNGKPVSKARVDALMAQVTRQMSQRGQPVPPDLEQRVRDQVVESEMFAQEAERRGLAATPEYKTQMELSRQNILIGLLVTDVQKKNPISDAEIQAEYDRYKAQAGGTEYRARHILVEKEEDAKALIAQLKGGAKFEDLAKANSKDPGSAENGGDLDFAAAGTYVPEFSQAMTALQKGAITETPVKTQFGYHIIKLEDTRPAQFPALAEVKEQIQQRLFAQKADAFRKDIRAKTKTDYKFAN